MTRRMFLAAPAAALAARDWDRRAFPDWDAAHIDRILTDSPWARPLTVPFRFQAPVRSHEFASNFDQIGEPLGFPPGWGGNRAPTARSSGPSNLPAPPVLTEIYLTARFASALPVRQALALHLHGKEGVAAGRAREILQPEKAAEEIVVELAGFPVAMATRGVRRLEAELLESAQITVKGHQPIRAVASSIPEHGEHLMATLRFPRKLALTGEEGTLEFWATSGPIEIQPRFKLRDMEYRGRLEL